LLPYIDGDPFATLKRPVLFLTGTEDCICPPWRNADLFYDESVVSSCKLELNLVNGTHCDFDDIPAVLNEACHIAEELFGCQWDRSQLERQKQFDMTALSVKYFLEYTLLRNGTALTLLQRQAKQWQAENAVQYRAQC
jgi:hypothetical protein